MGGFSRTSLIVILLACMAIKLEHSSRQNGRKALERFT